VVFNIGEKLLNDEDIHHKDYFTITWSELLVYEILFPVIH